MAHCKDIAIPPPKFILSFKATSSQEKLLISAGFELGLIKLKVQSSLTTRPPGPQLQNYHLR